MLLILLLPLRLVMVSGQRCLALDQERFIKRQQQEEEDFPKELVEEVQLEEEVLVEAEVLVEERREILCKK
jgi:hypothetical protein